MSPTPPRDPSTLSPRFLLLALPLAVLPSVLVFLSLAAHRRELPPNLLLGFIVGGFAWTAAAAGALAAQKLRRRVLRQGASASPLADALAALLLSLVAVAALNAVSVTPLFGVLPVVAWGLPLPALLYGLGSTRRATRFTGAAAGTLAALIAAVAVAGPPGQNPARLAFAPAQGDDLVVLSWNIGQGPPLAFGSDAEHLAHVARTIVESGADVACLQEVATDGHLERLLAHLGPQWRGSLGTERLDRAPAVLTRVGGEFSVETPEVSFFGGVRVRLERSGRALDIYSAHLAPARHAWLRSHEVEWFARRLEENRVPAVFTGDLNIDPASPWDRLSCLFTEDPGLDEVTEARLATFGFDAGRGGVSTGLPARRIDRILVREPLATADYEVLFGKRLGRMDHRPLRARVSLARATLTAALPTGVR